MKHKDMLVIYGNMDDSDLSCSLAPAVSFTVIRLILTFAARNFGPKSI